METKQDPIFDAIKLLQKEFSLIDAEGKIYILKNHNVELITKGEGDPTKNNLHFYANHDAKLWMYRLLTATDLPLTEKDMSDAIGQFMRGTATTMYTGVAFHPNPKDKDVLNLWRGHAVEPVEGDCTIFLEFIRAALAGSSDEKNDYLLKYLAHAIQRPQEKPEVMIVFISGQGTGKGSFFSLIRRIWPYTTLQAQDVQEVLGRFTGSLERSMFVLMDEALFTHDRKSSDQLKSKVAEPVMRIEEKHQPARTINSLHRFIAATNHSHFANIDHDDRRLFICEVSDVYKQDTEYFKRFHDALKDDHSVAAFVYHLMNLDISDFNVRQRPQTNEHIEQKLESLSGIDRWWFSSLHDGRFSSAEYLAQKQDWDGPIRWSTQDLKAAYLSFNKQAERYTQLTEKKLIGEIKKLCPSAINDRWTDDKPRRGLELPSLQVARDEFCNWIGGPIDWEA